MSRQIARELIELTGGIVNGMFVDVPGITLIEYESAITKSGVKIVDHYRKKRNDISFISDADKVVDFANRLTYFNFFKGTSTEFINKLKDLGHISFFERKSYTFLLTGISQEALLEIISNKRHIACRTTSSNTVFANQTLYANVPFRIREYVEEFTKLRSELLSSGLSDNTEIQYMNQFNLSFKAGYLVISMDREDFYKVARSRIKDNCENEVTYLFTRMIREIEKYEKHNLAG